MLNVLLIRSQFFLLYLNVKIMNAIFTEEKFFSIIFAENFSEQA